MKKAAILFALIIITTFNFYSNEKTRSKNYK
jgi:hypothetical protein